MSIYLSLGVILFCLTHLYPVIFRANRQAIIGKIGENPYKGIYSLSILLSLALIIFGWRSSDSLYLFDTPEWGRGATSILMYLALFLFMSAKAQNNVKRVIRHPQLCSILLWGIAHLLSNGESRSLVLFGIFALWAPVMMFVLNRRDGAWQKPNASPIINDLKTGGIALIVYAVLVFGHSYFTGVSLGTQ